MIVSAALVALVGASAAQAAGPLSCRASAARATLIPGEPALVESEPVRANPVYDPCSQQSSMTVAPTSIGPVSADAVGAFTARGTDGGAGAFASAANAKVDLGALVVEAPEVQATATAACSGGAPMLSGSSKVVNLVINGQAIQIPPGDAPQDLPLGPLGTISLNQQTKDPATGDLTQRAVSITTPLGDVVLAEARIGATAAACSGGDGDTTAPTVCPAGSTYDASHNVCVIQNTSGGGAGGGGSGSGGSGGTEGATVVGAPFQGPSGGTVVGLDSARAKYKSPCLKGPGPKYVVVGTDKADHITGTNHSDRILLLGGNDNSEGGRGNDCMDGAKGRDTLSGALGKDRLYGGKGVDHLVGGSSADRLYGGSGADTINTGYGEDVIKGGSGKDRINASTAGPAVKTIRCGSGRDKIRVNRNERKRARNGKSKCERVYVIR